MSFTKITPQEITQNAFSLIGTDWMLIAAGNTQKSNCMTASWGGFGVLWNVPVVFVFIRPQRYTNEFITANSFFSLNFFNATYKDMLQFCGKNSGKTIDKARTCNLTTFETDNKTIAYEQSNLVIECKKLYAQQLQENSFIDISHLHHYPNKDFHIMYVAEITNCYLQTK